MFTLFTINHRIIYALTLWSAVIIIIINGYPEAGQRPLFPSELRSR